MSGARAARSGSADAEPVPAMERFARWIGVDEPWERVPGPRAFVQDARIAATFLVLSVVSLELIRSLGVTEQVARPVWQQYAILLVGIAPLLVRRRFPLLVATASQAHFFLVALTMAPVAYQLVVQFLCFFGLYSGVAWARDRRALLVLLGAVFVFMFGWLAWDFALGNSVAQMTQEMASRAPQGLLPPMVAWVLYSVIINVVFFGGAVLLGQNSWHSARRQAIVVEQAATIAGQAAELRDQAVVQERLRIARELHDVVAHHVSVMGVQAAAARRVLDRRPDAAADALSHIEEASRQAVGEMRRLLGTLRSAGPPGSSGSAGARGAVGAASSPAEEGSREPGPGIEAITELVAQARTPGFEVGVDIVQEPDGALAAVPAPMALSVYRVVQEALSNVRKHSSASRVGVVVRVRGGGVGSGRGEGDRTGYVEAEVVDNGRPLGSTSGSGLGLLGMRERVASHGGVVEAGPRLSSQGYRVRVRFPLPSKGPVT